MMMIMMLCSKGQSQMACARVGCALSPPAGAVSWDSQQARHSLDQGFHMDVISTYFGGGIKLASPGTSRPQRRAQGNEEDKARAR